MSRRLSESKIAHALKLSRPSPLNQQAYVAWRLTVYNLFVTLYPEGMPDKLEEARLAFYRGSGEQELEYSHRRPWFES